MSYYSAAFSFLMLVLFCLCSACGFLPETPQPDADCFPACSLNQTCALSEDRLTARCVDTFTGGGPLNGSESCQWLAECVDACEHQQLASNCAAACEQQAEEDIRKAHSTWRACVRTNCNAIRSPECLREWCAPQTARCFGELPGDALTIGPMSCFEIADCTQDCNNDPECQDQCRLRGTKSAQVHWATLNDCAQENCTQFLDPLSNLPTHDYQTCTETQCPQPWTTCFGPGPNPPEGTASCSEIHLCMQECSDSICQQNCSALGTLRARQRYNDFIHCGLANCNNLRKKEFGPATCLPLMCEKIIDLCFNDEHSQ